jgi:sulfur carrier protein ThiS
MKITINGKTRQFSEPLTVAAPVETLGYTGKREYSSIGRKWNG